MTRAYGKQMNQTKKKHPPCRGETTNRRNQGAGERGGGGKWQPPKEKKRITPSANVPSTGRPTPRKTVRKKKQNHTKPCEKKKKTEELKPQIKKKIPKPQLGARDSIILNVTEKEKEKLYPVKIST